MEGRMKAKTLPAAALASLVAVVLALSMASSGDAQNTGELSHVCNTNLMPDTQSQQVVVSVISDVVSRTSESTGFHRKTTRAVGSRTVTVIGACSGGINREACNRCMNTAIVRLRSFCVRSTGTITYAAGAQITLVNCRLRWELFDFNW